jgi:hypothetical protein
VLPTTQVERVVLVNKADIETVESLETLRLNGQAVSLVRLEEALGLPRKNATDASVDCMPVAVLAAAEKRVAFVVEAVLGEQEVLVKARSAARPRAEYRRCDGPGYGASGACTQRFRCVEIGGAGERGCGQSSREGRGARRRGAETGAPR